ncbi:unnamed protein product [Effrenium voratum]|uniref:Uncharacterized protein n=1 Tax=Effrenium voratum TaxID=2562239 RepID=A0AA36MN80_9DINO|nr:unnamed protein product [Effrenium voratum]CAJ1437986.1 unnamed protein product [Effrenium voratum]
MALKLISLLLAQVALARLGQNASVLNRSNATSKDANVPLGEGSALEIMVNGTRHGLRGEKAASDLYANDTDARSMAGRYAGYQTFATTTRYGDADAAACGGMHTGSLVGGLPYYSVASAQSMWKGCCWCGHSGGGQGTHGLGCFSCAKGRFLRSAYGLRSPDNAQRHGFASGEIIIVASTTTTARTTTWTSPILRRASTTTTLSSPPSSAPTTCRRGTITSRGATTKKVVELALFPSTRLVKVRV